VAKTSWLDLFYAGIWTMCCGEDLDLLFTDGSASGILKDPDLCKGSPKGEVKGSAGPDSRIEKDRLR
jgi:hypothetical protein